MEYFRLGQDRRIPYGVLLTKLESIDGYRDAKKGNLFSLERIIVSFVNSSPINFYPDILDRQLFMIKGVVKEVFDLFLPELDYKYCCLLDNPNNKHEYYYIPILETVTCLTGNKESIQDTSSPASIVLNKNLIGDRHIFRVADAKDTVVIASLEVIEAVLRRNSLGVILSPVSLV